MTGAVAAHAWIRHAACFVGVRPEPRSGRDATARFEPRDRAGGWVPGGAPSLGTTTRCAAPIGSCRAPESACTPGFVALRLAPAVRLGARLCRGGRRATPRPGLARARKSGPRAAGDGAMGLTPPFGPARQRRGLDGRTDGDDLVWTDVAEYRAFEEALDVLSHHRDTRRATDQKHLIEVADADARDVHGLATDLEGLLDDRARERFELRARHAELEIEGFAPGAVRDFGESKHHLVLAREPYFDLLRRGPEPLVGLAVRARIGLVLLEKHERHAISDGDVDVVATEEGVAGGREDLEHVFAEVEQSDVEVPPPKS